MHWNYRIIKTSYKTKDSKGKNIKEYEYGIHEVFYNSKNKPNAYTADMVYPYGETLEEFKKMLGYYVRALKKPVLKESDFKKAKKKKNAKSKK